MTALKLQANVGTWSCKLSASPTIFLRSKNTKHERQHLNAFSEIEISPSFQFIEHISTNHPMNTNISLPTPHHLQCSELHYNPAYLIQNTLQNE